MQLPALASIDEVPELMGRLEAALAAGDAEIDAGALEQVDTATLAMLLELRRSASTLGRSLRITGAPAKLRELARLYGVEELLPLAPSA